MQIAFESAPGVIAGFDNPGARSGELRAGLGVGDCGRCQVREVPDPLLGVRRQGLWSQRAHHGRTPQAAIDQDRRSRPRVETQFADVFRRCAGELVVAFDPGGAAGAEYHGRDAGALERKPHADGHLGCRALIVGREHESGAVGLVAQESRVGHAQVGGQLVSDCREHLRRGHRTRDQHCHPSQRGLQIGEPAELIPARLGLQASSICLDGARPRQVRDGIGHQGNGEENAYRHPILGVGRHEFARPVSEVVECDGAHQRRRHGQPEPPHGRDHQDAHQKHDSKCVSGGHVLQRHQ